MINTQTQTQIAKLKTHTPKKSLRFVSGYVQTFRIEFRWVLSIAIVWTKKSTIFGFRDKWNPKATFFFKVIILMSDNVFVANDKKLSNFSLKKIKFSSLPCSLSIFPLLAACRLYAIEKHMKIGNSVIKIKMLEDLVFSYVAHCL